MKSLIKKFSHIFLAVFLVAIGLFVIPRILPAFAQTNITVATSIPGTYGAGASAQSPGAFIANFYWFALIIGGVLAFGVVVYGGIKYMTSSGNPSGQSDAKEWIEGALLGLLLLIGVYFILSVVNPQLLNLNLPSLTAINLGLGGGGSTGGGGGTTPSGPAPTGCAGGGTCVNLPNCTTTSHTNCGGTPAIAAVLNCIDQTDNSYQVNEAYPPIGDHSDPGHNTGCAIDVHVSSCAQGAQFMAAATACHASKVLNEYSNCGGTTYAHTTGGNIHIDAPKGQGGC